MGGRETAAARQPSTAEERRTPERREEESQREQWRPPIAHFTDYTDIQPSMCGLKRRSAPTHNSAATAVLETSTANPRNGHHPTLGDHRRYCVAAFYPDELQVISPHCRVWSVVTPFVRSKMEKDGRVHFWHTPRKSPEEAPAEQQHTHSSRHTRVV